VQSSVADPDQGSGAFSDLWIRGWEKKSDSGPKLNITDHIPRAQKQFLGKKYLNSFMRIRIQDPGWKNSDPRSRINIPDPQHWCKVTKKMSKSDLRHLIYENI
jgi:hypothetical protein